MTMSEHSESETPRIHAGNVKKVEKKAGTIMRDMIRLVEERGKLNAEIAEDRASLKALGLNTHAIRHALSYAKMSADQREGYDVSLGIGRRAMDCPLEPALPGLEVVAEAAD